MKDKKEEIEKEDWRKAPGVWANKGMTNSAFATRNYSINCNPRHLITIIKGYHVWWCSSHHQPLSHCQFDRATNKGG